jgi:NADH-quinone oxidoreductase subunit H
MTTFLSLEPIRILLYLVGIIAFVGANAAYLVLAERKGAGRIQRRPGPNEAGPAGVLQPLADGLKLMAKQVMAPPGTDGLLYRIAPLMVMAPPLMCLVTIPFGDQLIARNINIGLLFVFAFGSINVMALMLGGWASRNKYSIMSAARVVSQNVAYEIPMLLVVITMIMMTGTLDLNEVVKQQAGGFWNWNIIRGIWDLSGGGLGHIGANILAPVTFIVFYICMLAETNRAPFDMAEAESELVAGAFTEYGGMGFGVFFMAEYANIVVGCSVATVLFFGGYQSPIGILSGGAWGTAWFLLKAYALIFSVIWVRWTFPRTQFYNLLNLSWKILIPISLVTLLLTGITMKIPALLHHFF